MTAREIARKLLTADRNAGAGSYTVKNKARGASVKLDTVLAVGSMDVIRDHCEAVGATVSMREEIENAEEGTQGTAKREYLPGKEVARVVFACFGREEDVVRELSSVVEELDKEETEADEPKPKPTRRGRAKPTSEAEADRGAAV